jgi:hypothetical protein
MYFDLPKTGRHAKNDDNQKRSDYASDERMSEIRDNVEDHWGSPPILTPETLAYILENQWVSDDNGSASDVNQINPRHILFTYKTMIVKDEKE